MVEGPAAPALLRLLAGRPIPHTGTASLDGRPLQFGWEAARHGPEIRPVAAVLHGDRLPVWRTSLGAVAAAVRAQGVPFWLARRRARQALGWAHASSEAGRAVAMLDVQARQRVLLARALAVVPGLLLLASPGAMLSRADRLVVYDTLQTLAEQWEMVVLVSGATELGTYATLLPTVVTGGTVGSSGL